MSNYPDDINMYNHHPSSPFYDLSTCIECGEEVGIDTDCDEDGYFSVATCYNKNCSQCEEYEEEV